MHKLFKALLLGLAAGILSVVPLIFRELPWVAGIAFLLHWLALGVIVTFARMPLTSWAAGMLIAVLTGLPLAILAYGTFSGTLLAVVFAAVLGGMLGCVSDRLINRQP